MKRCLSINENHFYIGGLCLMYYCTCTKLWTKTIKIQIHPFPKHNTFAFGEPSINQYNKFRIPDHLCWMLIWYSGWKRIPFLMYWLHSCPQNCLKSYFSDLVTRMWSDELDSCIKIFTKVITNLSSCSLLCRHSLGLPHCLPPPQMSDEAKGTSVALCLLASLSRLWTLPLRLAGDCMKITLEPISAGLLCTKKVMINWTDSSQRQGFQSQKFFIKSSPCS